MSLCDVQYQPFKLNIRVSMNSDQDVPTPQYQQFQDLIGRSLVAIYEPMVLY